ncbi:MAG: glycosyltransferase family 4 protein, partial [Nitrospira sp.]|nr:glycosyltransferase family 4 protein [Nitrospira sp.]
MIFGTLDSFVESNSKDLMLGRHVANLEFLTALLRYGSFDQYHFFMSHDTISGHLNDAFKKIGLDENILKRIKLSFPFSIEEKLKNIRYNVFHHSDFMTYFPSLAYIRNRYAESRFPITGVTHSISYREDFSNYAQMLFGGTRPYDSIICTSRGARDVMIGIMDSLKNNLSEISGCNAGYNGRFDHIPLGIDVDRFQGMDKSSARLRLELPLNDLIVLGLGRFSVYTKMDIYPLLNAFKIVMERIQPKNAILVLAGMDELNYIQILQDFADKLGIGRSVKFVKDFSDVDKTLLYASADVFVSPSDNLQETFGLSVTEAMAAGKPVVVSDFDGYKDLVVHGETGYKVPAYWLKQHDLLSQLTPVLFRPVYHLLYAQSLFIDIKLMAHYITELLLNKNLREEMGQRALEKARREFSWKVVIKQYEALWNELSLIARNDDSPAQIKDPFQLDYFSIFKNYPTGVIDADHSVRTTSFGQDILSGR